MSESTQLQEIVKAEIQKLAIANGSNSKPNIETDPRALFAGERESLSIVDAYSEFIMNVFDLSTDDPGRKINMCISSVEKPKNTTVQLNIYDDGPGIETGVNSFLNTYMKLHVTNKADNNRITIGEAGIGAKTAAAKLGKRHHYSWSHGHGEPRCHFIVDKDNFFSWNDYEYREDEDYEGPSFFNISIEKLNHWQSASAVRDQLAAKFAGTLERHPNVSIYTCKPNAIQKIESHEKLCRIMQKQTHDKIHKIEHQINRVESILLVSVGALITGMAYVIFTLITK